MEFNFEDSFFDEDDGRRKKSIDVGSIDYTPKQCIQLWYVGTAITDESTIEHYSNIKYEADLLYCNHDYAKALVKYKERYSYLTVRNHALLRENCESTIRCCLLLNQNDEAMKWTIKMFDAQNNPADSTTNYLAYQVYLRSPTHKSKAFEYLTLTISVNPWYPKYWYSLVLLMKEFFNDNIKVIEILNENLPITINLMYAVLFRVKCIVTDALKGKDDSNMIKRSNSILKQIEDELVWFDEVNVEEKNEIERIVRRKVVLTEEMPRDWLIQLHNFLLSKEE